MAPFQYRHRSRRTLLTIIGCVLLSLSSTISPYTAEAQQTTASIVGSVFDSTGAIVVGARVSIVNMATNETRTTVTNDTGEYNIPSLLAGNYSLRVEKAGFATQLVHLIVLQVSQTARQDFHLSAGEVTQSVSVSASAELLQTENASVGSVIDGQEIDALPLNGRNFIQLAQMLPGVNTGTEGSITVRRARGALGATDPTGGTTAIQVDGQRDTQNRYSIDGIEAMDYDAWTMDFSTSIDAIAEMRVDTSSSGTDSGAAAGANVNQIIKSGTNRLHGTLYEFNRNNALTSQYDALAKTSIAPARLNRNQFGGNLGGPVVIPHVYNGHNKTFFFFNTEHGYNLAQVLPQQATVPDASLRSGVLDSSVFVGTGGQTLTLTNPFTGHVYHPGDHITLDPNSAIMLRTSITPAPTIAGAPTAASPTNYYTPRLPVLSHQHQYVTRIDENLSARDTLAGHYIYDDTYSFSNLPFWGNDQATNNAITHHYALIETHVFSPTLVNEIHLGRNYFYEHQIFGATDNPAYNIANGLMNIPLSSSDPRFYGPPNVTINNTGLPFKVFSDQNGIGPRDRSNSIYQLTDNLSWQRGKHLVKFGVDLGRRNDTFSQARDPRGSFSFTGQYTGSAMLDFLLGYVATDSINPTVTRTDISSFIQAYSVQDEWRLSPTLTLDLGLRWDHFPPYRQDNNEYADITVGSDGLNPGSVITPANSPYGRGLLKPTYHDIQPRAGFAWQPLGVAKMVVRAGAGVYFTPEIDNAYFEMAEGDQAQAGAYLTGNPLPNLFFSNPFPGVTTTVTNTYPFAIEVDPHLQDQVTYQYNLTTQYEMPWKLVGQIGYVGAHGSHNFTSPGVNIPYPIDPRTTTLSINARRPNQNFQRTVYADFSNGSSSYNSLQAELQRRVGQGLNMQVSYTWSKSISGPADVGGLVGGGAFGAGPLNVYDPRSDRSLSIFDVPQRFDAVVLYDVPFFHNTAGWTRATLDGFRVSTNLTAVSGDAAGVTDNALMTGTGVASRPDAVPGVNPNISRGSRTPTKVFNTAAFSAPTYGDFGTSPRSGAVRLPGIFNDDFTVSKTVKIHRSYNIQLRADFFNLFRHYNPDPSTIGLAFNSTNFGMINNGLSGGYASRIIQLSGRLTF